jgi:hypothetical protein
MQVEYPHKKTRQADRLGQAHKVFFAHEERQKYNEDDRIPFIA